MALHGDSINSLAELLGISRQTLCDKRDERSQFKPSEITILAMHWDLGEDEIVEMFSLKGGSNESQTVVWSTW